MKIWIHKHSPQTWYRYWKPKWLNTISRKEGEPKIYRWLCFGYEISQNDVDNMD